LGEGIGARRVVEELRGAGEGDLGISHEMRNESTKPA
jgi:hypothetical protein